MIQELIIFSFFVICAVPFIISLRRGRFDIFEPIVWFSIFQVMIGVAFIDRLYLQEPFIRHSHLIDVGFEQAFLTISILYMLFTALVVIGYYIDITSMLSVPTVYHESYEHDGDLLRKISYIYIIFGSIFYLILIWIPLDGRLLRLFTTTEPRSQLFAGYAVISLGAEMLHLGYAIWIVSKLANGIKPRPIHLLPIVPIMSAYLLLGDRGQFVGVLLNILIILYYSLWFGTVKVKNQGITLPGDRLHFYARQLSIPILGIGLVLIVILSRGLRQARSLQESLLEVDIINILTGGIHNSQLDYLIILLEIVPDEFGYYYGTFYVRAFLNWIPRAIWSDKPVLTIGSKLRRVILPEASGGRPPGIIGRYFVDFGFPGVIVGALITGMLMRYIYELLRKNGHSPLFLLIYVTVLFSVGGGVSNSTLFGMTSMLLLLIPVLIADRIFSHRSVTNR